MGMLSPVIPIEREAFGAAIDVAGDRAVISGYGRSNVYVFQYIGFSWNEFTNLRPATITQNDNFGISVSQDGDRIVVGASSYDQPVLSNGTAFVFELINGVWQETQQLTGSVTTIGARFGTRVAINGDRILVTSPNSGINSVRTGLVYVFSLIDNQWVQSQILTVSDSNGAFSFASSLQVTDEYLFVGAPGTDLFGNNEGAVYIYRWIDGVPQFDNLLLASDAGDGDNFGLAIHYQPPFLVVGAPSVDAAAEDAGAVYVYHQSAGDFVQTQKLLPANATDELFFGRALSMNTKTLAVDALNDEVLYLYGLEKAGWVSLTDINSTTSSDDGFGFDFDFTNHGLLVGALNNDDNGINAGIVYQYLEDAIFADSFE